MGPPILAGGGKNRALSHDEAGAGLASRLRMVCLHERGPEPNPEVRAAQGLQEAKG
jgi:hypothetical protein